MLDRNAIYEQIWPVLQKMIAATLLADEGTLAAQLVPAGPAADVLDLFGVTAFEVLLKTVLERDKYAVSRVLAAAEGVVYLEYAWPGPAPDGVDSPVANLVTCHFLSDGHEWRLWDMNPSGLDLLLTLPRAQAVLMTTPAYRQTGQLPRQPWILPLALYAGLLQLPLRPAALADDVELMLLPGLQARQYELTALVNGRRLWRDFNEQRRATKADPAAWAAALEVIMSEQAANPALPATVAALYGTAPDLVGRRVKQIKRRLEIDGLDARYTSLWTDELLASIENRDDPDV